MGLLKRITDTGTRLVLQNSYLHERHQKASEK